MKCIISHRASTERGFRYFVAGQDYDPSEVGDRGKYFEKPGSEEFKMQLGVRPNDSEPGIQIYPGDPGIELEQEKPPEAVEEKPPAKKAKKITEEVT